MGQAGPYTACAVLARYGYGSGLEAAVMGFTGARNDKPPDRGLDAALGLPYAVFTGIARVDCNGLF